MRAAAHRSMGSDVLSERDTKTGDSIEEKSEKLYFVNPSFNCLMGILKRMMISCESHFYDPK